MLKLVKSCRVHLSSVDESYIQHLFFASRTGLTMVGAGLACVIHGLLPFLFESTGSRTIEGLAETIRQRRNHVPRAPYPMGIKLPV